MGQLFIGKLERLCIKSRQRCHDGRIEEILPFFDGGWEQRGRRAGREKEGDSGEIWGNCKFFLSSGNMLPQVLEKTYQISYNE